MADIQCSRCAGQMVEGFIVDNGAYGIKMQASWYPGQPTKGWRGIKAKEKETVPITTYRCSACGYLESFAVVDEGA